MSLINDALRRASQTEKDRPRRAATPMGMEAVPAARKSALSMLLVVIVLVALLLACWCFWQWWTVRNKPVVMPEANTFPSVTLQVNPQPVVPKPAPVAPAVPVVPVVAPAPVKAAAPPVVVPAPPVQPPAVVDESQVIWPVDLKLSAIFFSKTNPHVLINGTFYVIGDKIQGVVVKEIEKNKVTVEWNGHGKVLMMEGN